MVGWVIPPPKPPVKTPQEFARERRKKVKDLEARGFLRSPRLKAAMLKVPREAFIPPLYRDYAYLEVPLPLPGAATISCPHSYPLFYEALGLDAGHRFLEVGAGSGYGAALAWEVVGPAGLVVTLEIDPETCAFARDNLKTLGYGRAEVILGDGSLGYPPRAPYDRICFTAAAPAVPPAALDATGPRRPPHRAGGPAPLDSRPGADDPAGLRQVPARCCGDGGVYCAAGGVMAMTVSKYDIIKATFLTCFKFEISNSYL